MAVNGKICEIVCDTAHLPLEKLTEFLKWDAISDWLYILHDKDTKTDGTPKNPHYHVYLRFYKVQRFETVAKKIGIPVSFVSKIHGRFADALAYATHKNAPEKYQYDPTACVANFDFSAEIAKNEERKETIEQLNTILEGIDNGTIKEYNITSKISLKSYVRYAQQIQKAFEYKLSQRMQDPNRDMQIFYIYGQSGLGKTTLAKMMASKFGYATFVSSSSNDPFDGYSGQECIILDDIRGSSFSFSDLLKILDPHTNSMVKKRYKNIVLGSDVIFLTSIKTPEELYSSLFESDGEEVAQFYRRIAQFIKISESFLQVFAYDFDNQKLEQVAQLPNPVKQLRQIQKFDARKEHEKATALFSFSDAELSEMLPTSAKQVPLSDRLVARAQLGCLDDYTDIFTLEDYKE